jgi:hypothetical protein
MRPSVCIAQGTLRRDGGYIKPAWYVCRVAPRAPKEVADASDLWSDVWGVYQAPKKSDSPLFDHLLALCVPQPGHSAMGRRLLQTDLVRVQGGSQGSGRCGRCFGLSAGAHGVDPAQKTHSSLSCSLLSWITSFFVFVLISTSIMDLVQALTSFFAFVLISTSSRWAFIPPPSA